MNTKTRILLVFDMPVQPKVTYLWFKVVPRVGECIRVDAKNYLVRQIFHLGQEASDKEASIELLLEPHEVRARAAQ